MDTTNAVLGGVEIVVVNLGTAASRRVTSQADGGFVVTTLPPGEYRLRAVAPGFRPTELQSIVLNGDDRVTIRVKMEIASRGEDVTVVAEASRVSASPAVSTVIDRQFVENLPLNGRSLQSLLELSPGVVIVSSGLGGQFSVNGQRANSNYFTVDGVSANVSIGVGQGGLPGQGAAGLQPGMNALGGTNSMVSVDALQEFRIQTSTFAPEFGRTPGGQVSLVTRSGTNALHGSISEYFRDDALDATDWFTNNRGLDKPELRQHNFGGVLGGPVLRDRVFFFGSYEGLRLLQPRFASTNVPTAAYRQNFSGEMRALLDALPLPNGRDLSPGVGEFSAAFSDPSRFDTTSARVDYNIKGGLRLSGRINHAPSYSKVRSGGLSFLTATNVNNDSVTVGATWIASQQIVHDTRINYARGDSPLIQEPDNFGGAVPPTPSIFHSGLTPSNAFFLLVVREGSTWQWGASSKYVQRQFNLVHSTTITSKLHELKFGVDYRRSNPLMNGNLRGVESLQLSLPNLLQSRAESFSVVHYSDEVQAVAFDNLSVYAQDTWKVNPKLTLTYGLRWEFVPPPHATQGPDAVTLVNINSPYSGQVGLAPSGTSLWRTRYTDFSPRIGGSYRLIDDIDMPLVIRGGFGGFYDIGFGNIANAYGPTFPLVATKTSIAPTIPLSADAVSLPSLGLTAPSQLWVMDPNLRQPYTLQWNVSAEQSLGSRQTLTAGYVGSNGRRLLKSERYNIPLLEWPSTTTLVAINKNSGHSDYHSLQVQYQRRLSHGIQALLSYTLGHARDTASTDGAPTVPSERVPVSFDYGYADFDVRHVLTAAVTLQSPGSFGGRVWRTAASNWAMDVVFRARSAFPYNPVATVQFPPGTQSVRPNVRTEQPMWIDDSTAPNGRVANRSAFSVPAVNTQGDLPRGFLRGFGVRQTDLALRRDFRIARDLRLQLRFEMFNLFNTPLFADPERNIVSSSFGRSTQPLARGLGGLASLYQIGGPRSSQVAVKLLF